MTNRIRFFIKFIVIVIAGIVFCLWQNNDIVSTNITYENSKIPVSFDGYTIVQISDLHNKLFGSKQARLLTKIDKAKPDIIVITGDLIDSNHTNINVAMELVNRAVKLAPVYFVSGNHEAWSGVYSELKQKLMDAGVIVLDDEKLKIEEDGSYIDLIGISDPSFPSDGELVGEKLEGLVESNEQLFKILLSHRPELIEIYASNNIDMVFAGHAHGGQVRIPFVGGLIAPNQGIFPKYTSGTYTMNHTTLVVSRGLGNSVVPIRIFNRPEIISVTLKSE